MTLLLMMPGESNKEHLKQNIDKTPQVTKWRLCSPWNQLLRP